MQEFIYDSWNGVMNADKNPLRHIPDNMTRHMILQILAWTWCTSFSLWIGSITFFGLTAIAHTFILAAIVITVMTFNTAKRNPTFFIKKGYHTPSRSRSLWYNGKKIETDPNDVGGEHD